MNPGVNGLLISNKNINSNLKYSFYFLPYAKFGPDMRLGTNVFLSGSAGLALAFYESIFAPIPFIRLNGIYLYDLNQKFSIELETGIHTSFGLPKFLYVTTGISLI